MALNLINTTSQGIGANDKVNNTLLGYSQYFLIGLNQNAFYNNKKNLWKAPIESFAGIMLENLSLEFSTPWGDAGGAQIGKKIQGFVNSKVIKMLAGQSNEGFNPFICSDAWTQQKVAGDASPVKISLKFKAYNEDVHGCTNYNDIIKFLILICSPLKSATGLKKDDEADKKILEEMGITEEEGIGTATAKNLKNAAGGAVELLSTIKSGGQAFSDLQKNDTTKNSTIVDTVKNVAKTFNDIYNTVVSDASDGRNNANFTVLLAISNKINMTDMSNIVLDGDGNPIEKTSPIDWIITNFSFKPSTEFEFDEKENIPKPLWVDFDISLETRLSLSNRYINYLLIE